MLYRLTHTYTKDALYLGSEPGNQVLTGDVTPKLPRDRPW